MENKKLHEEAKSKGRRYALSAVSICETMSRPAVQRPDPHASTYVRTANKHFSQHLVVCGQFRWFRAAAINPCLYLFERGLMNEATILTVAQPVDIDI